MILKTKEFKEVADKILLAIGVDAAATNLELAAKGTTLRLSVTNKEFYCAVIYTLEAEENFKAVVPAPLFLSLISGITTETFKLEIKEKDLMISAGKSKYKVGMIYENDSLMTIKPIFIQNKTVEMPISVDILQSILNVNSKEVSKAKDAASINELQKLYYIDENGCFTFTTGACLNEFKLEKPVKMLLNDKIVRLFKLFKEDVQFALGVDALTDTTTLTKISLTSNNIYLAAIITCDDILISKVQGPCMATKRFITEAYDYSLVVSANEISNAINRLLSYSKNNKNAAEAGLTTMFPVTATIFDQEFIIKDRFENCEVITIENDYSRAGEAYDFAINLIDLKLVVDSCKNEHITFNCGNHRSIVITRGAINNLIPELRRA